MHVFWKNAYCHLFASIFPVLPTVTVKFCRFVRVLILGHLIFLQVLFCSQSWGSVSNRNSSSELDFASCKNLQMLYESNYSIARSHECQESFHFFKLYLTNVYNACRLRQGLPELSCDENPNVLKAAAHDAIQISAAVKLKPEESRKYFLEFENWVTDEHLKACVRKPDRNSFTKEDFKKVLESATREIDPPTAGGRQRKRASDEPFQFLGKGTKQLISTVAGAFLWRARGGSIETGSTQAGRLIFATLGYGGLGWFNGGTDGLVAGGLSSVPLWIYGWGAWQDQGRNKNSTGLFNDKGSRLNDALMMSLRGLFQTSLSGGYLLARGYDGYALASGGSMGLCYAGSYELDDRTQITQVRDRSGKLVSRNKWIDSPTALGEICTGAFMGAGLSTTLQNGRYEGE